MSSKLTFILGILLGIVLTIAITSLTVAIGCAVHGVSFNQQIVNWFSTPVGQTVSASVLPTK